MEQTKKKIDETFNIIEHRMINSDKMTPTDRRRELSLIDTAVAQLESELDRFQMVAFTKYPAEIDEFESRLTSIKLKLKKMNEEGITASQAIVEKAKVEEADEPQIEDAAQRQIAETNAKLKEGKERALGMLKTVNNMKEELNLIDDEVMLQREKIAGIRDKMKKTQSVVYQTKKVARNLAKSLNDDVCIKVLIGLIVVALLGVICLIAMAKLKKQVKVGADQIEEMASYTLAQYDEIDEKFFHDLEVNPDEAISRMTAAHEKQKMEEEEKKRQDAHKKVKDSGAEKKGGHEAEAGEEISEDVGPREGPKDDEVAEGAKKPEESEPADNGKENEGEEDAKNHDISSEPSNNVEMPNQVVRSLKVTQRIGGTADWAEKMPKMLKGL